MRRRKTAGAMLMFSAFVLIAAAPLAMSEDGTVHTIVKDENGPPSTCAETWEIAPTVDGTWYGHIVNGGMRWIIIDVMDMDTGDMLIDREMYRWMVYPEGWVDTVPVDMVVGHTYSITATPNGALGTTCTVTDVFTPTVPEPPVASFTVSVDGLTVSVDASASYDPDGTIVDYDWDFGDGSTGTGMTATHTYVPPAPLASADSSPTLGAPPLPHPIVGYTRDASMTELPYCTVTVTNVRLGLSGVTQSDGGGFYQYDLANMGVAWEVGDEIVVEAVKDALAGSATGYVTAAPYDFIDVILLGGPEPFDVTITLTVTDNDGMSTSVSQTVTLVP
ncbi:MAG: PKD domain-containing protein [Methanobacteriota archaeon]|nr:MAG: PKD domain-containing protein [Euryarchaeota archaeon]